MEDTWEQDQDLPRNLSKTSWRREGLTQYRTGGEHPSAEWDWAKGRNFCGVCRNTESLKLLECQVWSDDWA